MKKLYRSERDKKILGVCGGLAEYWKMDVTLMRLIWVVGFFLTFSAAFLLYLIAALIMPVKPEGLNGPVYDEERKQ